MGSDRVNSTGSEAWQVLPFANALTAATAVFSVALRAVRDLFTVVFNSQFLGANVASLSPPQPGNRLVSRDPSGRGDLGVRSRVGGPVQQVGPIGQ
jgi:hypothetical protein